MLTKTQSSNLHEPIKLVLVTMDTHLNSAANRAYQDLKKTIPGSNPEFTLQVNLPEIQSVCKAVKMTLLAAIL
jgi:hypothetical protein